MMKLNQRADFGNHASEARFLGVLGWMTLIGSVLLMMVAVGQLSVTYDLAVDPDVIGGLDAPRTDETAALLQRTVLRTMLLPAAILLMAVLAAVFSVGLLKGRNWGRLGLIGLFLSVFVAGGGLLLVWLIQAFDHIAGTGRSWFLIVLASPLVIFGLLMYAVRGLCSDKIRVFFDEDRTANGSGQRGNDR